MIDPERNPSAAGNGTPKNAPGALGPDAGHASARVEQGELIGRREGDVCVFRGIPYAAAPIGDLRWRPPQPPASWTMPRDAGPFGAICPQPARPKESGEAGDEEASSTQGEDCLTLNVWSTGSAGDAKPVMVWIHGGAFRIGTGSDPVCDGTAFAKRGIVLVTFNYRLGRLGLFAHPALAADAGGEPIGNYALMDQIASLRWVQRNIAAFGGDPSNVTVFGQSAGGESILFLLTSPAARGLFGKAIVQSGGVSGGWRVTRTLAEQRAADADYVAQAFGADLTAKDLRSLPVEDLMPRRLDIFSPFLDGALVVEPPATCFAGGRALPVPLIIGNNDDEAATFMDRFGVTPQYVKDAIGPQGCALYARLGGSEAEQIRHALTDMQCTMPTRFIAAAMSRVSPVWLYLFGYVPERERKPGTGAGHRTSLPFVFDTLDSHGAPVPSAQDRAKAATMNSLWASFAVTGQPTAQGTDWPRYEEVTAQMLLVGEEDEVLGHFRREQLDYLQALPRSGLATSNVLEVVENEDPSGRSIVSGSGLSA